MLTLPSPSGRSFSVRGAGPKSGSAIGSAIRFTSRAKSASSRRCGARRGDAQGCHGRVIFVAANGEGLE